jgi:hypothetical protein
MNRVRKQTHWLAPIALVVLFAACKGESPTAPPANGGGGNNGGTPPASGATVNVTVSSTDLEVDQTTVVTASVTQNGAAVPNGTAVEFTTTLGTFADSGTSTTIRTTTNGVATVSLSAATAGTAIVTATVNNVTRNSPSITFRARPVTQPKPSTDPTIISVTPTFGLPTGGETIRITGTNFRGRIRVFFDIPGEAQPREAFVTGQSETTIDVVTPNVQLTPGQELVVPIRVVVDADSANQKTVSTPTPFTYRTVVLTPAIVTASPNSGPTAGGTRVTIFGNNFQAPVQVLVGAAEAHIIGDVRFDSIIIETPPAFEALGTVGANGVAEITVVNINSGTRASLATGFRYTPDMTITGFTPLNGSALGGTDITVSGIGLDGRLQALVAGVEAQVIRTSGTSVLLRTNAPASPCGNTTGPIVLVNLDTGVSASSTTLYTYLGITPRITGVAGTATPGGTLQVTVTNPGVGPLGFGDIRFTVNGTGVIPSPGQVSNGSTAVTFNVAIPTTGFTFPSVACTTTTGGAAGTRLGSVTAPVIFTNSTTGCSDNVSVTFTPPSPNTCLAPPRPSVATPAGGSCATPGNASVSGVGFPLSTQSTISIANAAESQPLDITGVALSGANASEFAILPTSATNIAAGGSQTFTLTFDPSTAGAKTATVTFTTNSTTTPTLTVCVQANAAP